ncbi:hypothetical protein G9A89_015066 [Geosiphon pyriformis]|nr:hypothetical protein G9A89_015066 [Geosiphon pyriformis]
MNKAKPLNEVIFVGYSLGGVMATLGALIITILIPDLPKPMIYTYGLPRIGDIPFGKYANEKVRLIRATITNDDVATAPHLSNIFRHWSNYYSHFGEEIWSDRVNDVYKTFKCLRKNGELESDFWLNDKFEEFDLGRRLDQNKIHNLSKIQIEERSIEKNYSAINLKKQLNQKAWKSALISITQKNSLNSREKRNRKIVKNKGYDQHKVKIVNTKLLEFLEEFAGYAQQAYCLNDFGYGDGIFARAIKLQRRDNDIHDKIVIYFKGYELHKDTISNKKSRLGPYEGDNVPKEVKIDSAFYFRFIGNAERRLAELVSGFLDDKVLKKTLFYFTGHGEGGVWATLTALSFYKKRPEAAITVVTFGQPRIGNHYFAEWVGNIFRIFRVTNLGDYVVQSPRLEDGYRHYETEYWISNELNCNCENTPAKYNVYQCPSKKQGGMTMENLDCNYNWHMQHPMNFEEHKGPYFGRMMGECHE